MKTTTMMLVWALCAVGASQAYSEDKPKTPLWVDPVPEQQTSSPSDQNPYAAMFADETFHKQLDEAFEEKLEDVRKDVKTVKEEVARLREEVPGLVQANIAELTPGLVASELQKNLPGQTRKVFDDAWADEREKLQKEAVDGFIKELKKRGVLVPKQGSGAPSTPTGAAPASQLAKKQPSVTLVPQNTNIQGQPQTCTTPGCTKHGNQTPVYQQSDTAYPACKPGYRQSGSYGVPCRRYSYGR